MLDEMDVKILSILQEDCTRPVADIGKEVGLSTTPCWRRIQKLEETGVIRKRVAVLEPEKVNAGVTVFVSIQDRQALDRLARQVPPGRRRLSRGDRSFYRMSGEVDYLLRVVVPDIRAYDEFYKKMISRIEIAKVSSAFAMEQMKYTTALPLQFARATATATPRSANC